MIRNPQGMGAFGVKEIKTVTTTKGERTNENNE
jgi:hypothetical protein